MPRPGGPHLQLRDGWIRRTGALADGRRRVRSQTVYIARTRRSHATGSVCFVARPAPEQQELIPSSATHSFERLTAQERAVFDVLAARRGRVLSRQEIARRAGLTDLSPRRCDSLIVGIRRAVGTDRVRTIRRRGWMLVS